MRGFFFKFLTILIIFFILISFNVIASNKMPSDFETKKEIIFEKLKEKGFSDKEIENIFSDQRIKLYPEMLGRKAKGLNYMSSKFGLLTKKSILRGQKVLKENKASFEEIEKRFGIEKEIIVAIYRVETNLGNIKGNYPVFNSLLTMAVFENRRSDWASEELINLLVLSKNNNQDPFSIKGSWAGAFGIFIPSSYLYYAIDGNEDGNIDLFNFHDAMSSIANYLKAHGWETGNSVKNKKAVWAYNHCDNYVEAIFAYAKAIRIP